MNAVTEVIDKAWDSIVAGADDTYHWLKGLLLGQFDPEDQNIYTLAADMLACCTIPGVVIAMSARDAAAVIVRMAKDPAKREDVLEWILLCACLITLALPIVAAAAGLAADGVGALVTGLIGEEAAAFLRALILLLLDAARLKATRFLGVLNQIVKGNLPKLLKAVRFSEFQEPLLKVLRQTTDKFIAVAQTLRKKLLDASVMGYKLSEHMETVKQIIARLETWERNFYAVQTQGLKMIPKAISELQQRLEKILAEAFPKDAHEAQTGVAAVKPTPALPDKPPAQLVHAPEGKPYRDYDAKIEAEKKAKAAKEAQAKPPAPGSGPKDKVPEQKAESQKPPEIEERPKPPERPEQKANVKVEEIAGEDHATVNGQPVKPLLYKTLFHGSSKSTLGFAESTPAEEVAKKIYAEGLPGRGKNIDLAEHAAGAEDRAFRGTTQLLATPDGAAGAVLWADEGGIVVELKNVKGYDVNAHLEGRVKKPDGSFGGNSMGGEQEIAVPGRILPEQVESVGTVKRMPSGRLYRVIIPR